MATRYGTNHFVHNRAAVRYYKPQGYTRNEVLRMITAKEIEIGPPEVKNMDRLIIDHEEGRYFIEEGPRPTMYGENQRLFDQALSEGKTYFKSKDGLHYLQNPDGTYFGWPVGFITGPQFYDNGNPNPYSMSVNGPDGWHQRGSNYNGLDNLKKWAVEKQKEILSQCE
jgi:hypothetical protein